MRKKIADGLEKMPVKHIRKVIKYPRRMLWAFVMEGKETRRMVITFVRHGQGQFLSKKFSKKPTEEEMQAAMKQLKDIPRILPFFIVVVVPMPGVTEGYTLLAITLEKFLGKKISLLPDQFRKVFSKDHPDEQPPEA